MNVSAHHSSSIVADTRHPLDPLTYEELAQTAAILRDAFAWSDDLRVETIDIDEPAKEVVRSYRPGDPVERIARFKIYRRGVTGVWEGKIDLGAGKVVAKAFKPDARAMVAIEEVLLIEATVKADPRFQEALLRRGLLDELEYMCVDPWTVGNFGHEIENGRRVLNCFIWMRTFPLDNYYAHPVEGLHALVDLATSGDPARRGSFRGERRLHPSPAYAAQFRCGSADRISQAVGAPGRRAARRRRIHRRR